MTRPSRRRPSLWSLAAPGGGAILALVLTLGADPASGQMPWEWDGVRGGRGGRGGPGYWELPAKREIFPGETFVFCRIMYDQVRREPLGHGWNTDYPDSDINFSIRLAELTTIKVLWNEATGEPHHAVIRLTDPDLFRYPFIFMSDVGTVDFREAEVKALRAYLLKGGLLYVDDFWGDLAWEHWKSQIERALPPPEFRIVDIGLSHEIFNIVFELKEMPQVPSIQHWNWSGGETSERGAESAEPHCRGIFDPEGRLMVIMTHNTDIADGWEREGENEEYFREFSVKKSYPLGINIIVYAMTH